MEGINTPVELKELYKDYFRIGVACERITEKFTRHEIGNPDKEKLMLKHFNSMTFGNELKPAYNMGFESPEATEEHLPFVINESAKAMLDWAKANGMAVRGHVMIWHSQCPKEVFCKNYSPVTIPTDPELLKERPFMKFLEKLDPVCFVTRDVLLKRMESYIYSLTEYMYANDYATTIYAWDVVNEAIELADKTETGLRNSYWYQIIGEDFIYWAFNFAKSAGIAMEEKYGIPRPKLFYNDYNEWEPAKKDAIIAMLTRETNEHGSIISENLIDGIGMQGHLSDNNNIDEYITALMDYSKLVSTVHITELDVKCTCSNANAEYYQAVFYKEFFARLIEAKKNGAKLECVTFWGLTDDNSWIQGANPLLFHGDLTTKKSFDALLFAQTGESLGEPQTILRNLEDKYIDFEEPIELTKPEFGPPKFEYKGIKARGWTNLTVQDEIHHSGKHALTTGKRMGEWSGICIDVSEYLGLTLIISAWVRSKAPYVALCEEGTNNNMPIASVQTAEDSFVMLSTTYKVPSDVHSMALGIITTGEAPGEFSEIYLDDLSIKIVGINEDFSGEKHIGAIRGAGHLPFLMVTDKEAFTESGRSLMVTRQEKDATVKFDISPFIGYYAHISVAVKTNDKNITLGLDGAKPTVLKTVPAEADGWTLIEANAVLDKKLTSAEVYIETDGNSDMYIGEVTIKPIN